MKLRFFLTFGFICLWLMLLGIAALLNSLDLKGFEVGIIFSIGYFFKMIHIAFFLAI